MYKFIVLATILALACALPTPKPDGNFEHLQPVGYGHVGEHQTYVHGQPQAYVAGHNQVYVGGPHEYYGAHHGHHGGYQKSYEANSGYAHASPYYVAGYTPLYASHSHSHPHHSSPVVYNY